MRMREACAGLTALVQQREHVTRLAGRTPAPRFGNELELLVLGFGDRAYVPPALHDDFLPAERRVEVGDHAHLPVAFFREGERLRWRHVLVTGTERARRQLVSARRIEQRPRRAGTLRPAGRDHRDAPRIRIAAEIAAQIGSPAFFSRKGRIRSTGKTIVVAWEEPSSRSVCR